METLPVTLIVKAPNQQIEDQTIKCELSWTINKLKQHLSEVYPSKPPKHEQKLIYSGQLLNDSVMLKDILRQYDGQEIHTVHLVCTPKHTKMVKQEPKQQTPQAASPTEPTNSTPMQQPTQHIQNVAWTNTGGMDPNQYAMQLAWMQQTYVQYMTQYMQLAANSYNGTANSGIPATPNLQEPQVHQNVPEQPAEPQPAAAAAAAQRDPENPERDWLDVFYILSRLMVLFSVVYFYSSPLRFLVVIFLGFVLYLYQIGFFRNINNNNNNNNNNVPTDQVPQEEHAPSRLMVVWTFFATFFASLIPEIPNAI